MKLTARAALCAIAVIASTACAPEKKKFNPWNLEDLSPAEGFEYRLGPFDVPAGEQVQDCYFVTVPDLGADPIWIKRFRIALNPGSHHFNVFRVNTIINLDGAPGTMVHNGECLESANWADWPLVVNSQHSENDPFYDWTLPDGVDARFTPGEKLMLQTHYVNATTQQTPYQGRVGINFYRSTDSTPIAMNTLFATQQSIRICQSNPQPEYFGTCAFPAGSDIHIAAANGHTHSRGRKFDIFSWDGTSATEPPVSDRFYESLNWADPPMATGLDVTPAANGGVWWSCHYQWTPPPGGCDALNAADPQHANDCCYTFGPKTETNEHCNVFLYYWRPGGSGAPESIFCN